MDHIDDDQLDPELKDAIRNSNMRYNNFNLDIEKSYPNPNKYMRKNKDYNTLDYSDVTHGNVDNNFSGNLGMRASKNNAGKSNMMVGRGLQQGDLKPECFMPHQMMPIINTKSPQEKYAMIEQYKNKF
jgi:hypothetical protein